VDKLEWQPATPARCELHLVTESGRATLELNGLLGRGLRIESLGRMSCSHCGGDTRRRYGDGYCYGCFRTLARCDLCVVSPARCHFSQGTCREPDWGESYCMQPHVVYLANSSAPKVGLTRQGGEINRWLDQGASQGLLVARAATRHCAGLLEAALARRVSDRTDWRTLLRGDVPVVDLSALRDCLRPDDTALPAGAQWLDQETARSLNYPVLSYPRRLDRFQLDGDDLVAGPLLGVKGQYLLFEHGVFPVRGHRGWHVRVTVMDAAETIELQPRKPTSEAQQLELLS
jgi:hypothetical protein